jgi:hypothetical protein
MAEPERPGTWPRHAYRNWRGVHSVSLGVCVAIISIAAMVTTASAASAPAPPSWLDLVAQAGQIANGTNTVLLALDAIIRDSTNGTPEGYAYDIASDAAQLLLPMRNLVRDAANLTKESTEASADAKWAKQGWYEQYHFFVPWYAAETATPSPCNGPAGNALCARLKGMMTRWWNLTPNDLSLGGPANVLETVDLATGDAEAEYELASIDLEVVVFDAGQVALGARTLSGDAKDYPGNKEMEAMIQVIGTDRIATTIRDLIADGTGLSPHLEAQASLMRLCHQAGVDMTASLPPPSATMADCTP